MNKEEELYEKKETSEIEKEVKKEEEVGEFCVRSQSWSKFCNNQEVED